MPPTSLMATLRAATAEQHERTEALVPVLHHALDLRGYGAILLRFLVVYALLERVLARVEAWPDGFRPSWRAPLLERDVQWVQARGMLAAESFDWGSVPPMRGETPTMAEALGMLYVLEGASLGGQLIARQVGPRFGVTAEAGASFYAGAGAETGARWRAFGAMTNAWGDAHPDAWDDVVQAARRTFEAIAAPFVESPVVP